MRFRKSRRVIRTAISASWWPMALASLSPLAAADTLSVHEWGTFTTLSSSQGEKLSNLFVDASRLPRFVHGLPAFNFDSTHGSWPRPDNVANVTVKMETPVLYFYSDLPRDMHIKVSFRGGSISQWYPERVTGEPNPIVPVDFASSRNGAIEWQAHVLPPDSNPAFSSAPSLETPEWVAPRNTQSNRLRGSNGEVEKFLFYRGIGNFSPSLSVRFTSDGKLAVSNQGTHDIGYAMVYELPHDLPMGTAPNIWWEGSLAASQSVTVARPVVSHEFGAVTDASNHLRQAMVGAGLFNDEANALLNTWENSYFSVERGLKVFWIVPRAETDSILPLTISPLPGKLSRVIVGRSEILTPEFEAELINAYYADSLDKYKQDKYYLAYLDFLGKKGFPSGAVNLVKYAPTKNRDRKRIGTDFWLHPSSQFHGHFLWARKFTDGNAVDMMVDLRGSQLQKP